MKDIYDMELHEYTNSDKTTKITRVPGGWIYESILIGFGMTSVFVPWHDSDQTIDRKQIIQDLQEEIKYQEHDLKAARLCYEKAKSETDEELQAQLQKSRYALEDIASASRDKDYSRIKDTLKEYYSYELKKMKAIEKAAQTSFEKNTTERNE